MFTDTPLLAQCTLGVNKETHTEAVLDTGATGILSWMKQWRATCAKY